MGLVSDLVKDLIPGSLPFLLAGVAVAAALLVFRRTARWGVRLLLALLAMYAVLSLQGTSDALLRGLWSEPPLRRAADARGARVIAVLGNGAVRLQLEDRGLYLLNAQTAYNAIEAARVYALLGDVDVIASGGPADNGLGSEGQALAEGLTSMGVPRERIALEANSHTTRQQCEAIAAMLKTRGERQFVLITTPEHMWRASAVFKALGVTPIPSASGIVYGGPPFWKPTRYALQGSHNAIYEYIGVALYKIRGWI